MEYRGAMTMLQHFAAARRAGVPLLAIRTPDPPATAAAIIASYNGSAPPIIYWDAVQGFRSGNEAGAEQLTTMDPGITDPTAALSAVANFATRSLVLAYGLHRYLSDPAVCQAVCNLRDPYKATQRTLCILCPDLAPPAELASDLLILDEQLPDAPALEQIIRDCYVGADLAEPEHETITRAVDALAGLAAFPAEQTAAMCLTAAGLDLPRLWQRKRQMIRETRGLSAPEPRMGFAALGGLNAIKVYHRRLIDGPRRIRCVVLIDEIEKALAGATGGSMDGGVSQDQLQMLLTAMQDRDYLGSLWPGVPGSGKTAMAEATAAEAQCQFIRLDLGATRGSLVGESEQHIRNAFRVIDAVGGDGVLVIATCNRMGGLPPELKRRFQLGTFFFDLPSAEERDVIWPIYLNQYFPGWERIGDLGALPAADGWTGAEIRTCCMTAHLLRCTLTAAAAYVVPVARAAAESIHRLRQEAHGRYISASTPGLYQYREAPTAPAPVAGPRRIEV